MKAKGNWTLSINFKSHKWPLVLQTYFSAGKWGQQSPCWGSQVPSAVQGNQSPQKAIKILRRQSKSSKGNQVLRRQSNSSEGNQGPQRKASMEATKTQGGRSRSIKILVCGCLRQRNSRCNQANKFSAKDKTSWLAGNQLNKLVLQEISFKGIPTTYEEGVRQRNTRFYDMFVVDSLITCL